MSEDERRRLVPTGRGRFFRRSCLHHVLFAEVHVPVSRHDRALPPRAHGGLSEHCVPERGRFQAAKSRRISFWRLGVRLAHPFLAFDFDPVRDRTKSGMGWAGRLYSFIERKSDAHHVTTLVPRLANLPVPNKERISVADGASD